MRYGHPTHAICVHNRSLSTLFTETSTANFRIISNCQVVEHTLLTNRRFHFVHKGTRFFFSHYLSCGPPLQPSSPETSPRWHLRLPGVSWQRIQINIHDILLWEKRKHMLELGRQQERHSLDYSLGKAPKIRKIYVV